MYVLAFVFFGLRTGFWKDAGLKTEPVKKIRQARKPDGYKGATFSNSIFFFLLKYINYFGIGGGGGACIPG